MDPETINGLVKSIKFPLVLKNVCKWPLLKWTLDDWVQHMPKGDLSFRCKPAKSTNEPCWERNCLMKSMSFQKFIDTAQSETKDWFYFDYKYVHQWFKAESEFSKQICWEAFGFPEAKSTESTLWIGSNGAHTPCHQDTYGRNIVLQVFGRKRWLLFPPECGGMKPSRVPYEESSVYSQLNFYSPNNISSFNGVSGCRMVTLEPGDALVLPNRWWHYVEHISEIGIAINTWIPTEEMDVESRVEEALTKLLVAQVCKDLPQKCLPYILNPNEDDLPDIPLSVNILQLETTVTKCLELRAKNNSAKRIKLSHPTAESASGEACHKAGNLDIDKIIKESDNILVVQEVSKGELMDLLKENMKKNLSASVESGSEDEGNNSQEIKCDHFTSAIIRAISQPNILECVKNSLLSEFN